MWFDLFDAPVLRLQCKIEKFHFGPVWGCTDSEDKRFKKANMPWQLPEYTVMVFIMATLTAIFFALVDLLIRTGLSGILGMFG